MNKVLIWKIAYRYLRAKRSANAVNILSRISMVAIAVCSGAMIVIFSVFNGLESVVKEMYKAFYPDVRISVARGKFFAMDTAKLAAICRVPGVSLVSRVIEDNVFAVSNNMQKIITLKGIDDHYIRVNDIGYYIFKGDTAVVVGEPQTDSFQGYPSTTIVGENIINELGADITGISYITLNYPNAASNMAANPESAIQSLLLHPSGIFRVGAEFDSKYVLAALPLVQDLFRKQGMYSSIEIRTTRGDAKKVQAELRRMLGNEFRVETRFEQNRTLNMVMGGEKWAIYAILVLVLLIASFNMVGALSMLVLEKQHDTSILRAMGATPATIRAVFLFEGVLWSLMGGVAGIGLGSLLCLLQQKLEIVKLGGSFMVAAYPVELQFPDFALVIATILAVGLLTAWYPALRATRPIDPSLKSA